MVTKELKTSNGIKVEFNESPYYFTITVGGRTWYWNRDTGEFGGTSFKVVED